MSFKIELIIIKVIYKILKKEFSKEVNLINLLNEIWLEIKLKALKVDMDSKFKRCNKFKNRNKIWIKMIVRKVLETHQLIKYRDKIQFIEAWEWKNNVELTQYKF